MKKSRKIEAPVAAVVMVLAVGVSTRLGRRGVLLDAHRSTVSIVFVVVASVVVVVVVVVLKSNV